MADLKRELDEITRAKDSLERLSYQLIDEVRQTKNKVETQQAEYAQTAQDFKNKGKKLEEENRQMVWIIYLTYVFINGDYFHWFLTKTSAFHELITMDWTYLNQNTRF